MEEIDEEFYEETPEAENLGETLLMLGLITTEELRLQQTLRLIKLGNSRKPSNYLTFTFRSLFFL